MGTAPDEMEDRLKQIISAWERLRPDKRFAGMTLAAFKSKIQPSLDARAVIAGLESQMTVAVAQRSVADANSAAAAQLVVNAVKGDPEEGEDGELYETMGYVPKSEQQSGSHRNASQPPPAKS